MTSLEAAPDVLGWGEPAVLQARAAARVGPAFVTSDVVLWVFDCPVHAGLLGVLDDDLAAIRCRERAFS
jgi:hypothetical protein